MTSNQMPSASGVRIAGDDYQWLHAWRMCMEVLHENISGRSNPAVSVGVEEADVGNGDDVVLHRVQPPNVYMQVKYAVDNRTPVNLDYLDASGVLRKMVKADAELTADGTPVEMRLVTNRTIDPGDVLLRDRDGRDNRLLPRAAQGGPQSERGKARAAWAARAGVDEPALIEFLSRFHLDAAYDLNRLRRDVSLLMTANGLRSDAVAVSLGADWISQRVIAGYRRLSITDIKGAVSTLNLQIGPPWTTISIATIKRDKVAHQAAVAIDWVDHISGDTEWGRVEPAPPFTWDDLAAEVRTVSHRLAGNNRILVSGHMRQATGFLVGSELRRVMGYEVGVRQGAQLWTSEEPTNGYPLTLTETVVGAGPDTAIIVNVATDAAESAIGWIRETGLPVQKSLTVAPAGGIGPKAISTPSAANSLAVTIRDLARSHARAGQLHLFLIGPLGVAVLLGHHWNRLITTHIYEHIGGLDYVHAFTIEA